MSDVEKIIAEAVAKLSGESVGKGDVANVISEQVKCKLFCPHAHHFAYSSYGEVVRCVHGQIFMVHAKYIGWHFSGREGFTRLSKFWNPVKYRRAVVELTKEGELESE